MDRKSTSTQDYSTPASPKFRVTEAQVNNVGSQWTSILALVTCRETTRPLQIPSLAGTPVTSERLLVRGEGPGRCSGNLAPRQGSSKPSTTPPGSLWVMLGRTAHPGRLPAAPHRPRDPGHGPQDGRGSTLAGRLPQPVVLPISGPALQASSSKSPDGGGPWGAQCPPWL